MKKANQPSEPKTVKGYKIFNPDFTCRGFQYADNKRYKFKGKLEVCGSGFHFCLKAQHCFSYYDFNPENIVCEVEAFGKTIMHSDDTKGCTDDLQIGRRLTWAEVLIVANDGVNNTGHSNSGNWNSGNWNSGNWNSGNWNSGNWNSGNRNSGNRNSGNWNSGNRNSGNWNSGNWNSGDRNSGNWNSGDRNSGNWNSGNWNSGNWNSGNWNSGNWNSGNRNSGNWNSGNRNSGDQNSGYRNSGAFCTDLDPVLYLFNKPSKMKIREWENSRAVRILGNLDPTIWVPSSLMTDQEKADHPKHETTEGYLKTISLHEAWANMWPNLSDADREVFATLENFDAALFEELTGIKIS